LRKLEITFTNPLTLDKHQSGKMVYGQGNQRALSRRAHPKSKSTAYSNIQVCPFTIVIKLKNKEKGF
jgi:hypothetical protein